MHLILDPDPQHWYSDLATSGKAGAAGASADARSVPSRAVGCAHTHPFSVPASALDVHYSDRIFLTLEIFHTGPTVIPLPDNKKPVKTRGGRSANKFCTSQILKFANLKYLYRFAELPPICLRTIYFLPFEIFHNNTTYGTVPTVFPLQ